MNRTRRRLYRGARIMGDLNAISRGPGAMLKRMLRKIFFKRMSISINRLFR